MGTGKFRSSHNVSTKKALLVMNKAFKNGATCQSRTDDLMITNQLLYQLS